MYQVVMYRAHHAQAPWKGHSTNYSKTPIFCKPRFTAANFFPQIGLNMHIVNKQNPDLPRMFPFPKTCGKSGFYCT